MFFHWLRHRAAWLAFAALSLPAQALAQETLDWTEDALLHDGRKLQVRMQGNSAPPSFYLTNQKSRLSQFRLVFEHPDTHQTIVWQGARYFDPLLIDFVDGVPYLVVYGRPTRDTVAQYGCPELPYVYLRHGAGGWQSIPADTAPPALALANLSTHDVTASAMGRHFSAAEVANRLEHQVRESLGLVQKKIPRTLADWNTDQKRSAMVERLVGDCRPPVAPMAAVVLPTPFEGNTSVLESSEYVPEKAYDAKDWKDWTQDTPRANACTRLFQRVEAENFHQDLHFAHTPGARKRVPYARYGVIDPTVQVLCDGHVWFIRNPPDSNKIAITQYTRAGDLVFHTAFVRPRDEPGLTGTLRLPSLRSEGDYLYFDWTVSRSDGSQQLLKRSQSLRVPTSALAR